MPLPMPTGDWAKATWFLDPAHGQILWSMRYERAELEDAARALADVYPSDFCEKCFRELEQEGQPADNTDGAVRRFRQIKRLAGFLRGLYEPHAVVSEILALGVDLALVRGMKPPRQWLERLKDPDGVRGTEFELQLWANALRSGLPIRRVPEARNKTPDFEVEWNLWQFGVEAKSVETAEHDRVRFEHFPFIHPTPPDDREYHIDFAPEIQALAGSDTGRAQYRKMFADLQVALNDKKWELQDAGSPLGEYQLPGVGQIVIAPRDPDFAGRSATFSYASEASQEKKASRLLRPLQDAAAKFTAWSDKSGRIAVAVLDVPEDYNPDAVQAAVLRDVQGNQPTYRYTDAVIWRRIALHMDPEGDPWKTHYYYACFVLRLPWCGVPEGQLAELASLLLASPHRFFVPPRQRDKSDPFPSVGEKILVVPTTIDLKRGR